MCVCGLWTCHRVVYLLLDGLRKQKIKCFIASMNFIVLLYIVQGQFKCKYHWISLGCGVIKITQFVFCGLSFKGACSWLETNSRQNEESWKEEESWLKGFLGHRGQYKILTGTQVSRSMMWGACAFTSSWWLLGSSSHQTKDPICSIPGGSLGQGCWARLPVSMGPLPQPIVDE